jgi:hypothetical protein
MPLDNMKPAAVSWSAWRSNICLQHGTGFLPVIGCSITLPHRSFPYAKTGVKKNVGQYLKWINFLPNYVSNVHTSTIDTPLDDSRTQ